jgi:hypothetical protein
VAETPEIWLARKRVRPRLASTPMSMPAEIRRSCPYQKLGWPTLSEISCTQLPDVRDQTSSGRASFRKNSTSHSKRAHGSFCIFTRAFGSLFRSGSLTRVKMMQAADFWNLDYMTE